MTCILRVEYDVTGLDQAQIDALAEEACAQGEASDDHPDVPVTSCGTVESDVEAVSAAAPVTAGPPPGPSGSDEAFDA